VGWPGDYARHVKCVHCGASVAAGSGRFCSHCGLALPDAPRITADEYRTHADRYRAVASHPRYPDAMARTPRVSSKIPETLMLVLMLAFGVGGVSFIIGEILGSSRQPRELVILPAMFGVAWVGAIGQRLFDIWRFVRAPMVRVIAVIVDERTEVSGGGENSSASTTYYATLQLEAGRRVELTTEGNVAGMISRGDIGVAYTKGGQLITFDRFPA